MRGSTITRLIFVALLAVLCSATLSASPLILAPGPNSFNIGGTITVDNPGFNGCPAGDQCITWTDPPGTNADKADIDGLNLQGVFATLAGFSGPDKANISDLRNPPEIVGPPGFANQPFMSFNGGGVTTTLLINFIANGIFPSTTCGSAPAIGQVCTSAGSLFSFTNNPGVGGGPPPQASAQWVLSGVTSDGTANWTGLFTAQFGIPFQSVFAELSSQGFVPNTTYSATITLTPRATVPEPGPVGLVGLGVGLLVLSAGLRKRLSRR